MKSDINIEKEIKEAIILKGAYEYLKEYEVRRKRRSMRIRMYSSIAAGLLPLLAGTGIWAKKDIDARQLGDEVVQNELRSLSSRGSASIILQIKDGHVSEAQSSIRSARENLQNQISESRNQEFIEYLEADIEELDYLETVCLLKRGRFISAKKALKAISSAGGNYAEKANALMEKL